MAEIPHERGNDARDRYRAEIETGGSLLRLRLVRVILRGVRGMVRVTFVVSAQQAVIATDMWMRVRMLMVMDGPELVDEQRRVDFPMRVLGKGKVQGH